MIKYLRGAAGIDLGTAITDLRRSARGAAIIGLVTMIKYLRVAAGFSLGTKIITCEPQRGNGLSTTAKYLGRTTSGAACIGLCTTSKYLRRTASGAAGNALGRCRCLLMCLFTTSAPLSFFFCVPSSPTSRIALPRSGV
jgi:hypothetical protein